MPKHQNKYKDKAEVAQAANKRLWQCERKKPYPSKEAAETTTFKAYKCPYCEKWHRATSIAKIAMRRNQKLNEKNSKKSVTPSSLTSDVKS